MPTEFSVGQTVYRKGDRVDVQAVVREIGSEDGEPCPSIGAVEGGAGWWPEHALSATPV